MNVARETFRLTDQFPKNQQYGLTQQVQRSAVSICSNIAEGHNRRSTKEFLYFIRIAQGSIAELETQLTLATQLQYTKESEVSSILLETESIGKMLWAMAAKLNEKL